MEINYAFEVFCWGIEVDTGFFQGNGATAMGPAFVSVWLQMFELQMFEIQMFDTQMFEIQMFE